MNKSYKKVDDILFFLQSLEPEVDALYTDGKPYRFGKNNHFYYFAHERPQERSDGAVIYCYYGSFSKGVRGKIYECIDNVDYKPNKKEFQSISEYLENNVNKLKASEHQKVKESISKTLSNCLNKMPPTSYEKNKKITYDNPNKHYVSKRKFLITLQDVANTVWSYQTIDYDGAKNLAFGGRKQGCFHKLGELSLSTDHVVICEGYATAVSLKLACEQLESPWFDIPVLAAIDSSNLSMVAKIVKEQYPNIDIIIACDNDSETNKNTGLEAGKKAALASGGVYIIPEFEKIHEGASDFNDLHCLEGLDKVITKLNKVLYYQESDTDFSDMETSEFEDEYFYIKRHTGTLNEELKAHAPELIFADIHKKYDIIHDFNGVPYKYNGSYWKETTEDVIKNICFYADHYTTASPYRVSQIYHRVKNYTIKESIPWQNLKDTEIAFANGIYDLEANQLRDHNKNNYLLATNRVSYNEKAECPIWLRCLEQWFEHDFDKAEKILAIQEFFGYTMMPHAKYKKALFLYGPEHTGKSKILKALEYIIGKRNICNLDISVMSNPRERAVIKGKILNVVSEIEHGALLQDGGFKQLVSGGDPVQIDAKFKHPETIVPFAKHLLAANNLPIINDSSNATYARILLINLTTQFLGAQQDTNLDHKLFNEADGIAIWALQGAKRLLENKGVFTVPDSSDQILKQHSLEQNPLTSFIEDKFNIDKPESFISDNEFYTQFCSYHKGKPISKNRVSTLMKKLGYEKVRIRQSNSRVRGYYGLEYEKVGNVF